MTWLNYVDQLIARLDDVAELRWSSICKAWWCGWTTLISLLQGWMTWLNYVDQLIAKLDDVVDGTSLTLAGHRCERFDDDWWLTLKLPDCRPECTCRFTCKCLKVNETSSSRNKDVLNACVSQSERSVLTATFNSYGVRQTWTPQKVDTPKGNDKKFSTIDYVREGTPYTKFGTNPPTGGFWENGWNITKIITCHSLV